jgi:hypothetical protein
MISGIPDEGAHFAISQQFATSWLIPTDSPETYRYSSMAHRPFLYYWINGRITNAMKLVSPAFSTYKLRIVLRLVNVFYSALTVLFLFLLSKELIKDRWWQVLAVSLLTSTLMFVFLSGGINYDNLTNLCAFAGIYFLTRVFNGKAFYQNSLLWLICIGTGALVKFTILPLAAIMLVVWLGYIITRRRIIAFKSGFNWKALVLFAVLLGLGGLNFALYGVNLIKYHSLTPACAQLLTVEQCNLNPLVVREQRVTLSKPIGLQDIIEGSYPDPAAWLMDFWLPTMPVHIFGFLGHKVYNPGLIISFYRAFFLWIGVVLIRYWKRPSFTIGALAVVLLGYLIVLLQTNYSAELSNGFQHLGIQGRYGFPVIGILYVLIAYGLSTIPNRWLARITTAGAVLLFFWGGPIAASLKTVPVGFPGPIGNDGPMGEIVGGVTLTEEFVSQCHGTLTQFGLTFSTYNRTNSQPVIVRLIDAATGQVLSEQTIGAEDVVNGTWQDFSVAPVSGTLGKLYRISITSPTSTNGDAVSVFSSQSDAIPDGEALQNGEKTGRDLVFRYVCRQSPFTGWFRSNSKDAP